MTGVFGDDVSLGTLLLATPTGWARWFDARGPVDLVGRAVALDAGAPALPYLTRLPGSLRGLSLAGLAVNDDELALLVRRLPHLVWLDLRGTEVTAEALTLVRRLRRLRDLAVDESVLAAGRAAGVHPGSGVRLVTEGAELVPSRSGVPDPDTAGFNALVTAAATKYPGSGATEPDEARGRATVLLDAGRAEQALAVLAPLLTAGDPGLVLVAARCANEIGTAEQALAPLGLGPPTTELLAWRAVFLSKAAPAQAIRVARTALQEAPGDTAALWATCSAYLNAGQLGLAEQALAGLETHRPDWPDTAKLAARLARARRRWPDEIAAWHRVLADAPDNADALAGLARAQRSARPLSLTWMTTLNSAATADVDRHGRSLLMQVTQHRRHLARLAGLVAAVVALVVGGRTGFAHGRIGWVLVIGVLAAALTAALLWLLTPAPVRRVIRRTDDLTGMHRVPDWRRGVAAVGLAALALAVPVHLPESSPCGVRHRLACPEPVVVPTLRFPTGPVATFSLPPMPTFSMPPMPTFEPIPTKSPARS